MRCHHYCNTLRCPHCRRRFWKWAEYHTNFAKRGKLNLYAFITPGSPSGTASAPHADELGSTPRPGTGCCA